MGGLGVAYAGVSILNAIGAGIGGALGIDIPLMAEAEEAEDLQGWSNNYGSIERSILEAVHRVVTKVGVKSMFSVRVHSLIPPSRGLKSSSALVNALIQAILDLNGIKVDSLTIARLGVEAARAAGITVTGAFDDSLASVAPGAHITDNPRSVRLRTYKAPRIPVVILVPREENPIQAVDPASFRKYKELYLKAAKLALEGRWLDAIPINSLATLRATGARDLWDPLKEVLALECTWTAGVSGKGPALFALTGCPRQVLDTWRRQGSLILSNVRGGAL